MATTYSVGLEFRSVGASGIRDATNKLNEVTAAAQAAQSVADKFARQFQKAQATAERTAAALNATKTSIDGVSASLKQQNTANAETASSLLRVKRAYEELKAAATASAASGGKGFDEETVSRLRGLTTEIERYRERLETGKQASAAFGQELERLGVRQERLTKLTQAQEAAQKSWKGQLQLLGAQVKQLQVDLQNAGVGLGGLTSKMVGLAAQLGVTIGAVTLFKSSVDAAFNRDTAEKRLQNLTSSAQEYELALKMAKVASADFGVSQTEATNALGDTYARLKGVGYGLKEVNEIYRGFNAIAREGGVNAQEAAGAFFQFSQALGRGKLQGDEFVTIGERMPQVLDYIAKAAGRNRSELGTLSQEGKLTGDVLYKAMTLAGEGATGLGDKLTKQQATWQDAKQKIEDTQVALGRAFAPAVITVIEKVGMAALVLADAFEKVAEWADKNKKAIVGVVETGLKIAGLVGIVFAVIKAYQAWQVAVKAVGAAQAFLVGLSGPAGLAVIAAAAGAATLAYVAMDKVVQGVGDEIERLQGEAKTQLDQLRADIEKSQDAFSGLPPKIDDAKEKLKELKAAQDAVTKSMQAAVKAADDLAATQSAQLQGQLSVAEARLAAEAAINDVYLQQAERQLQAAVTQEERIAAAQQVYDLTVRQAELERAQTQASIAAATQQAALAVQQAQIKERELAAVVSLAQAQGVVTQAHYDALEAQRQALGLAEIHLETAGKMAAEQLRAADAIYKGKVAAADAQLATNLMSQNIASSAQGAAQLAANLGQAASAAARIGGGGGGGGSGGQYGGYGTGRLFGVDFGNAGKDPKFAAGITSAIDDLRNVYGNRPGQFQSGYYSIINEYLAKAQEMNKPKRYAAGGYVTGPQSAMIGEGGESEYIIPASKMESAMASYASGKRGSDVVGSGTPQVNIRTGPVTQMDGQRYLTLGDAQKIAADATQQTLGLIRRDPSVRRSLGVAR